MLNSSSRQFRKVRADMHLLCKRITIEQEARISINRLTQEVRIRNSLTLAEEQSQDRVVFILQLSLTSHKNSNRPTKRLV